MLPPQRNIDSLCTLILMDRHQLIHEFENGGLTYLPEKKIYQFGKYFLEIDPLRLEITYVDDESLREALDESFIEFRNNELKSIIEFKALFYYFRKMRLNFKVKNILRRESPDFSYISADNDLVHIEVSEAIPGNLAVARKLINEIFAKYDDKSDAIGMIRKQSSRFANSVDISQFNYALFDNHSDEMAAARDIHPYIIKRINKKFLKYKSYELGDINYILVYVHGLGFSRDKHARMILEQINTSDIVRDSNITIDGIFVANRQYDYFVEYKHLKNKRYGIAEKHYAKTLGKTQSS